MNVKVFFGTSHDQLTNEIQAWLDAAESVVEVTACQCEGTNIREAGQRGVFVTVFYK